MLILISIDGGLARRNHSTGGLQDYVESPCVGLLAYLVGLTGLYLGYWLGQNWQLTLKASSRTAKDTSSLTKLVVDVLSW
jgi:xanthosine utilization system XapX-like protein